MRHQPSLSFRPALLLLVASAWLPALAAQERGDRANWAAAEKFAPANLRKTL